MKAIIFDFDGVIHDTFELGYTLHKRLRKSVDEEQFKSFFDANLFK